MISTSEGFSRFRAGDLLTMGTIVVLMALPPNALGKDAVQFSRIRSPDKEGIVHFAANKPALAALQREREASASAGQAGREATEPRPILRARASGQRGVDDALTQLLRGFAELEGELSKVHVGGDRYRVQPGDTLDEIIFKTLGNLSVRHEVVRDAFVQANPRAFRRKNPNYLLAGVELKIPGAEDFRAVVFDDPQVGQTIDRRRMIRYP